MLGSLFQFVLFPLNYCCAAELPQWVYRVDSCPDTSDISNWIRASDKLNCYNNLTSDDPNEQKRVYQCMQSSFLNETVEFCSVSVSIEAGYCPVFNYTIETNKPQSCKCSQFTSGCPKRRFYSKGIYKYPNCLNPRQKLSCQEAVKTSSNRPKRDSGNAFSDLVNLAITLSVVFVVLAIVLIGLLLYVKKEIRTRFVRFFEQRRI